MSLDTIHTNLFVAHILYSVALGIWATILASRGESISGNFWGAIATYSILAIIITIVGIIMTAQGLRPARLSLYYLYMAFLVVIMPGLFSMLRGRDDRSAAIAFAILALFNASVSFSMIDRMVTGPWV